MKLAPRILVFLFWATFLASSQNPPLNTHAGIILMTSSDAPGDLSRHQLQTCLRQLAHEWKLREDSLPTIFVFHVSKKVGHAARVSEKVVMRHNQSDRHDDMYYEVWLAGEPAVSDYVLALQNVLEHYFQMTVTDEERKETMSRVARYQDATVDVHQGK